MKQRIRRIWLALCMAVCLFALAGCSAAADTAETIDPQIRNGDAVRLPAVPGSVQPDG